MVGFIFAFALGTILVLITPTNQNPSITGAIIWGITIGVCCTALWFIVSIAFTDYAKQVRTAREKL